MRYYCALTIAAFLAPSINALPQLEARGQDSCAKDVRHHFRPLILILTIVQVSCGPAHPPKNVAKAAAAKSDCFSFLRKTVSPCPMYERPTASPSSSTYIVRTSTTTKISTKTAKAITKTATKTATKTSTAISTVLRTTDRTVLSTQEQTQPTTVNVPITTTTSTIETSVTTSTIFETLSLTTTFSTDVISSTVIVTSTVAPVKKRGMYRRPDKLVSPPAATKTAAASSGTALDARAYKYQCHPSTASARNIPGYASACRNPAAYASACQKLGVGMQTTTLKPSTIYTTKWSTKMITPTVLISTTKIIQQTTTKLTTQVATKPITLVNTVTKTQTILSTSTATIISTITEHSSTTTTATLTSVESLVATTTELTTSVTLVAPTPPAACTFTIQVSGTSEGQYINTRDGTYLGLTNDATDRSTFALDSQNRLYQTSNGLYANINDSPLFTVYLNLQADIPSSGYLFLTCTTTSGQLKCSSTGGQSTFFYCPSTSDGLLFGNAAGQPGCSAVVSLTPSCI